MKKLGSFLAFVSYLIFPVSTFAHEAYVLSPREFHQGLQVFSANPFAPLIDSSHLSAFIIITGVVVITYTSSVIFSATSLARKLDLWIKKARPIGPLLVRMAISAAFLSAAFDNSVFGPELVLPTTMIGHLVLFLLVLSSVMIFFGILVELAGLISLGIFAYMCSLYGSYLPTYTNYLAEIVILFLFGSRIFSVDKLFFKDKLWLEFFEKLRWIEIPIIRICYGGSLVFAALTIKFWHQDLAVSVYNQYHLVNFFHADASFIAAGAGLSELLIGLFIALGFAMRLTILISLVFITLSLLYFHELVWPHLMLYGISFGLFINSADKLTIDHYLPRLTKYLLGFIGIKFNDR